MSDSEIHHITIHPVISYPREAEVGKTYLMSIDIQTEYDAETWPYEREDFALHCILDTKPLFNHKAFGEPVIVLNRFGGTYGPATFLLTTATAPQEGAITVTLVNEQGFPLHQMTLPDISVVRETKKPIKTKMLKRNFPIPAPPTEIAHLNKSTAAIQGEDGLIFGTSFLAAQDILFTCAHVVLAAESGPDQMISLRFYGRNEIYRAKVLGVYWSAPEEEDIAVLQLINAPLPDAISPVLVGPSTDCFDHEFISFGYSSKDYTDGLWASGQIRGLINGDGRLQLASKEMHLGMSGAPVVDKESGWVVGMVNAIYRPDNTDINGNTAFAISTERMRRVWPDLPWQTLDGGPDDNLPTFPLVNLPPPNPNFTGRQELLAAIQSSFDNQQSSIAITQAIAGLGGVGKTQLALAFAHQHRDEYDLIWLLRADDPATLDGDLRRLGENLSLPVQNADTEAARQMVLSWLNSTEKRWLLLYDDADWIEPRELSSYLPGGHGHVLITSRRQFEQLSTQTLQLVVFTSKEAAVFLQNRLGTVDSTFEELATELGYLPLALEQAAAFILARQITPVDYLRLFRERRQELLAREQPPEDYHATITTVWEMAFELAGQTPGATELLSLCSFLASDDISLEMIVEHANTLPEALAAVVTDALARGDAVAALTRYSLLTVMDGVLTVHRLVQVMTRDHMERSRTQTWAETAVDLLFEAYRFDLHDMITWTTSGRLLPHLLAASNLAYEWDLNTEHAAHLNNEIGVYLNHFGDYSGARPYYERALAIWEKALGPNHPSTAVALNNVGSLLRSMGDLTSARPYLERALQIDEKAFGPEHPGTAASLNNLGSLFQDMGDLASARPYMERVLAIREKTLGSNHPDTAVSLNNLGTLLRTMGDLAGARPFMERALAIREKALGSNHPDTAISLNNLGGLLYAMGDLTSARPYYERALSIYEKALGPDHPSTAQSLNNLGFVLNSMGDLAGAQPYYERALAIREKTLGPTHPSTAASLGNLGNLLQAMGDSAGARPYFERALAIQEKSLGPDHPDVANSLDNIGSLLRQMDDLSAARPYFVRALAIREKALGPDHPYVATSLINLGYLLRLSKELVNARNLFERALAIQEKSLGPNHPDVAATLNNLGLLTLDMQDATAAHEYLSRSLKIIEARLGTNHPSTQIIKQNLSLISSSGAVASEEGATAIGARGVFVGGNVQGSIITGDSNTVLQAGREISPFNDYQPGQILHGHVVNIIDSGAFVELSPGVQGRVHISELAWHHVDKVTDIVHRGQSVKVQILDINREERLMDLTMRLPENDPFRQYKIDQRAYGNVVGFTQKGTAAFVELEPGVDGFLYKDEISVNRIVDATTVLQQGQRVQVRITELDYEERKMRVTMRGLYQSEIFVPPTHAGLVIGSRGSVIKGIMKDTGTYIDLDDDGYCTVQGLTQANVQASVRQIEKIIETKIVEFDLQERQMHMLIGKSGRTIKGIQERTGAIIDTQRNGNKVTITAPDASVLQKTLSEIQNAISYYETKIQVPSNRIGRVIGRGGSTINMITNSTNTWINIEKGDSGQISVGGATEYDVNRAISMIRAQAGRATVINTEKGTMLAYTELRTPIPRKFKRESQHELELSDYSDYPEKAQPNPKVSTDTEPAASKSSLYTKSILLTETQLAKLQQKRGGFFQTLLGGGKSPLEDIRNKINVSIHVVNENKTIHVTGNSLENVQKAINLIEQIV